MKVIIDRFEGKYAVCEKENRKMINIEVSSLPEGVKEGDVLDINCGKIKLNKVETQRRNREIKELTEDLWKD